MVRILRAVSAQACLVLLASLTAVAQNDPQTVVRVAGGTLSGEVNAEGVRSFKGIPYAAPPVGGLRWKPPVAAMPWKGTRSATTYGTACMQTLRRDTLPWTREFMVQNEAGEDCLFLNVWTSAKTPPTKTPAAKSSAARQPVLVFVHGGGFTEGAGGIDVYDGAHLAKKGVVVVTLNYRLGVFGFLAHPALAAESPHHSSGNYGLLDQVAALRWIQANVARFGGDPAKVTLWGQSAGAFSVGSLIASPLAKGLFRSAIADSGVAHIVAMTAAAPDAQKEGETFARAHKAASLQQLRALPAKDLMASIPGVRYRPNVDGWVLPAQPRDSIEQGGDNDVALLTGYQSEDGRSLSRPVATVRDFQERIRATYGSMADDLLRLYPVRKDEDAKQVTEALGRDRNRISMYLLASRRAGTHRSAVYTYFFTQAIPWPQHPEFGAFHTGELPYFFANLDKLDRPWTDKDREVSRITSQYIVDFAAKGSPNASGLPFWPKAGASEKQTMELGVKFAPIPVATPEKLAFWTRFLGSPEADKAPLF